MQTIVKLTGSFNNALLSEFHSFYASNFLFLAMIYFMSFTNEEKENEEEAIEKVTLALKAERPTNSIIPTTLPNSLPYPQHFQ